MKISHCFGTVYTRVPLVKWDWGPVKALDIDGLSPDEPSKGYQEIISLELLLE
jgi:hypothetical protein